MLRSESGKAIASKLPRDRILTETDGPFATEGSRPLQPRDSWQAVSMLAEIWSLPVEEVTATLGNNLRTLGQTVS
jgi:TatD DNase family protein